jgi:hypothetical protein
LTLAAKRAASGGQATPLKRKPRDSVGVVTYAAEAGR